ncbi:MAG: hypothetical protein JRJ29_05655 [Deltaproteobacteria bacterium]|nr:hypothetical protein [Deltaproteobacteria bacterium]
MFVIGFLLVLGWYFFLAICYRLEHGEKGEVLLISPRRTIRARAGDITLVEVPGVGIGLIRFRVGRERVYLFCKVKNETLKRILLALKELNPDMKFKNLVGIV